MKTREVSCIARTDHPVSSDDARDIPELCRRVVRGVEAASAELSR